MAQPKQQSNQKKKVEVYLSEDQIIEMINLWPDLSEAEIALKFSTEIKVINTYANLLRKEDPSLCPKKRRARQATVIAAIKRYNASIPINDEKQILDSAKRE